MAITDQKERYIITLTNGERITALASTFAECLLSFGEENVEKIEKLEYKGVEE